MEDDRGIVYGFELIMDLHGCDASTFNRESLDGYFEKVCHAIEMEREDLHFWDYDGVPEEERTKECIYWEHRLCNL